MYDGETGPKGQAGERGIWGPEGTTGGSGPIGSCVRTPEFDAWFDEMTLWFDEWVDFQARGGVDAEGDWRADGQAASQKLDQQFARFNEIKAEIATRMAAIDSTFAVGVQDLLTFRQDTLADLDDRLTAQIDFLKMRLDDLITP